MLDQAIFQISVGGTDVTETFNPILQQLQVEDRSGESTDHAMITLADVDGSILLPSVGDSVNILLGWKIAGGLTQVFDGIIDEVASRGSREAGRLLVVKAHGFDTGGKAKEPQEFHKDNASLQDFLSQAAGNAGLSFQAESSVGGIQRPYWVAGTESFIHLGQRIAHEVGAVFKIQGTQAYMWPLNTPMQAAGGGTGSVNATWGQGNDTGNLIEWDIAPVVGRPQYAQARTRWFDHTKATWKDVIQAISGIGSDYAATHTHRQTRADQGEATTTSAANEAIATREAGTGIVTIVGQPAAFSEGSCTVSGVRPGVDGTYRIAGVRHELNRSSGFITQLELKQPGGGAGTDPRPVVPDLTGPPPIDSVPAPATPP
jgi:phage protein D